MVKFSLSIFIALIFALSINAQVNYEEGKPSELKGLTKIFVETEDDLESYKYIIAALNKAKLPKVKIVDKVEAADIVLDFLYDTVDLAVNPSGTATATNTAESVGNVLVVDKKSERTQRIILNLGIKQDPKARNKTANEFVKAFVKIYKKANNIK